MLAAFGVSVAWRGAQFVTVAGMVIVVAPIYVALFWLIFERQAAKDAADDATRTSRTAYRKARAIEDYLEGREPPATGRHHR